MTAATAALAPGPLITGPGPGATADDTRDPRATSAAGNASSPPTAAARTRSGCAAAPT